MNAAKVVLDDLLRRYSTFGAITSTYDPRQMQLGVKVLW
jgi:hypothetical protein